MKYIFDLDGTICPIKGSNECYEDLIPFSSIVNKIRELKRDGAIICIFTSRNMRTYDGNVGLININTLPTIINWLNKWKIPFDEVIVGKPWPGVGGFYIDDRAIRPRELISMNAQELVELCNKDRLNHE